MCKLFLVSLFIFAVVRVVFKRLGFTRGDSRRPFFSSAIEFEFIPINRGGSQARNTLNHTRMS